MKLNIRRLIPGIAMAAALAGGLLLTTNALAATHTTPAAPADGICGKNLACVIAFGNARIAERIAAMQKLIGRINANTHLTSTQQAAIVGSANTAIAGLQTLQGTLDKETNVTNARSDVKNIYVQFRIFVVQLPADYLQAYDDHLTNVQQKFVSKESEIQQDIQKAGNPGNTTQLYNDLVTQVTDAGNQIGAANGLFPNLVPANYPNTDGTKTQIRTDLRTAHSELHQAWQDLKSIIAALKTASGTPTPGS